MSDYHGILLDTEFKDKDFLNAFEILGKKRSERNTWTMHRVRVPAEKIDKIIRKCQENLLDGEPYYCHFYRDEELIIVFKQKVFRVKPDKSTWKHAIEYGLSLGIPADQMEIKPVRFEDETY